MARRSPGGLPGVGAQTGLPVMPTRANASPWDELATAYEVLPARDLATRLRWQFRAAEVWETGAGDVKRAFDEMIELLETTLTRLALEAEPAGDDNDLIGALNAVAEGRAGGGPAAAPHSFV